MTLQSEQVRMAEMMEKYELGLSHLYKAFSERFPEQEEFWNSISADERTHAFLVRTFKLMIEEGSLVYQERPFTARDLENYLKDLNEHMNYVRKNEVSLKEALSIALEMESRIMEKKVFEVYKNDSPELKRTLTILYDDTQQHSRNIKELYDKTTED